MTENISNLIVAATSLCGGIVVAILAGMTIWTFRDIRSRTRDPFVQILATVMVGVIPIAGILVYFMLRPRETLAEKYVRALEEESLLASIENQEFCPTCGRRVDADMQFCPSCHAKLRNACPSCGRAVHLSWDLCPYCGVELTPEMPTPTVRAPQRKQVDAPTSAPTMPALVQPHTDRPSVLDRVSDAIGSVVDRMFSRSVPSWPSAGGQQLIADEDEAADVPPMTPPAQRINGTTRATAPRPARRPAINREELE